MLIEKVYHFFKLFSSISPTVFVTELLKKLVFFNFLNFFLGCKEKSLTALFFYAILLWGEKMAKDFNTCLLLDYYGSLLTKKQQLCLSLYYNEDLSLSEIAEEIGGTRQAALDLIHRAEKRLQQIEAQLQLVQKAATQRTALKAAKTALKAGNHSLLLQELNRLEATLL